MSDTPMAIETASRPSPVRPWPLSGESVPAAPGHWLPRLLLALAWLGTQAGCMSALTATTLREALRETAASMSAPHDLDHASRPAPRRESEEGADEGATGDETVAEEPQVDVTSDEAMEKVIDNAVARLSAAGGIDSATQELLIQTLEKTPPQDWAVVVNEFAATLEAARGDAALQAPSAPPPRAPAGGLVMPVAAPVAPAELNLAAIEAAPIPAAAITAVETPAPPAAVTPAATVPPEPPAPVQQAVALIEPSPAPAPVSVAVLTTTRPEPPAAPLPPEPDSFSEPPAAPADRAADAAAGPAVNNPCFATRVRGWGQVERFPTTSFQPGQELIVYFELDRLLIRAGADGHTTSVDSDFRLLDASGERVGQWTFEPIVETCPSPRRDYFVRYFLRIPDDAKPGAHRLEWSVTDTLAGATRQAHLDLVVAPAP